MRQYPVVTLRGWSALLIAVLATGCTSTSGVHFGSASAIQFSSIHTPADQSSPLPASPVPVILPNLPNLPNSSPSPTGTSSPVSYISTTDLGNVVTCDELSSYDGTSKDASQVILSCIQQAPAGGVLELPAGRYMIANQITFDRPITLRTQGKAGSPRCDYELGLDCAALIADPSLNVQRGLIFNTQPNVTLDHIVLDGNREARIATATGAAIAKNCSKDNSYGFNALTSGAGFSFIGSVSKRAICGTGMGAGGDGLTIQNSAFVENGDHRGVWSDGLTVGDASNSKFIGNLFLSNSDVDFIFGGCKNCVIQNNVIQHGTHYRFGSFAAFMTHAWPNGATSGDYSGSDISHNQINCGSARRCGFGMMLGADPWYQASYYGGGDYHDNTVANAQEGLIIDHTTASIHVHNNMVLSSAGGTNAGACGIRSTESYDVSANSTVDFSGDGVLASLYQHVDWKGCIANSSEYLNTALATQVVSQVYQDILGRLVDDSGLATFSGMILRGTSVSQVWIDLAQSAEASSLINSTYMSILGRPASSSELSSQQAFLADGHTLRHLRAALILSSEGQQRLRQSLVQSLGYAPSASELQGWGSSMVSGLNVSPIFTTTSVAFNTSYSVLKTFYSKCGGSSAVSPECSAAVHRFCSSQGFAAGGFGPVEHSGDVAVVVCVPAAQASMMQTTLTELQSAQPLCDPSDPTSLACGSAVSRVCMAQKYNAGGYGPLELSGNMAVISCVSSPRADLIIDTLVNLQSYQPACDLSAGSKDYCASAVHRRCKANGYVSGYGLTELANGRVEFSCLR